MASYERMDAYPVSQEARQASVFLKKHFCMHLNVQIDDQK